MATAEYYRIRRAEFKSKGLCVACGAPPESPFALCDGCRESQKKAYAKVRERRQKQSNGVLYEPKLNRLLELASKLPTSRITTEEAGRRKAMEVI